MTLPQVPIPAGIPLKHFADQQMNQFLQSLPGKPEMITVNVDPAPRNSLPPIPCSYLMGPNPLPFSCTVLTVDLSKQQILIREAT